MGVLIVATGTLFLQSEKGFVDFRCKMFRNLQRSFTTAQVGTKAETFAAKGKQNDFFSSRQKEQTITDEKVGHPRTERAEVHSTSLHVVG